MKKADIVFHRDEPISFGFGLCHQLLRHGLCEAAIAMPYDHGQAMQLLRASTSDCVVFLSPHMHRDFIRDNHANLLALNKPLLGYVSEWIFGNDAFPEARDFHREADWFHYYGATQNSDVDSFRLLGMKCDPAHLMIATDIFHAPPPDQKRIGEMVYIGHNNPWKTERIRIVNHLRDARLIREYSIPRTMDGAHIVAGKFRQFAAALCPPAHGRAHSIRCYEAAACGSLIVECQPLDKGNEYFIDGIHRVAFPSNLPADELCGFITDLHDFDKFASIARNGRNLVHQEFRAEVSFSRFLASATKAIDRSDIEWPLIPSDSLQSFIL
jgi:hypothetical protein